MKPLTLKRIIKYQNEKTDEVEDSIAIEKTVKILVNNEKIISLSASPIHIKELIIGFLMTEGILKGEWCPESISLEEKDNEINAKIKLEGFVSLEEKTITSGCMASLSFIKELKTKIDDDTVVSPKTLFNLFKEFQIKSTLYRATGCFHVAALADKEKIFFIAEDVGRHNALDKVIGWALLNKIPFHGKIMLVSGRISSEMVLKTAKWKIPIIVSRAAPTSLAVEIAENIGLTIVGFLRGNRFNIYCHGERINEKK
ncbi:MAG: formate dehydrogenase accessory sulfurtransferase FdhD [Thermodesulfovibrio sp.]|nr:formate dehydrogenase accessory sulfurtransferase FdhD [Thermodesulfovibrio sp.]MCX7725006.1 formate dehydrogenase accessory sulfurtransferase FdhD [Thermodesulfovibrio sp.]MDW7972365.1 formate dehydrogenase accessory sulfurtransferase FdhD [Thermodesulfovibrio sp.]